MDETYQYDALTRRIVTETAAGTRHYYFNSQWRAIEERVSGAVKAQYVWNPADRWDLIRRKRSVAGTLDEIRFVLRDYLDPAAIIDGDGQVIERYRYDAFGPVTVLAPDFSVRATSECGWNFLYHAEFIDALTGLYNYGYRYYHPDLGRWISRDPIAERGGLNLYSFVGNDGIGGKDLLGRVKYTPVTRQKLGGVNEGTTYGNFKYSNFGKLGNEQYRAYVMIGYTVNGPVDNCPNPRSLEIVAGVEYPAASRTESFTGSFLLGELRTYVDATASRSAVTFSDAKNPKSSTHKYITTGGVGFHIALRVVFTSTGTITAIVSALQTIDASLEPDGDGIFGPVGFSGKGLGIIWRTSGSDVVAVEALASLKLVPHCCTKAEESS